MVMCLLLIISVRLISISGKSSRMIGEWFSFIVRLLVMMFSIVLVFCYNRLCLVMWCVVML